MSKILKSEPPYYDMYELVGEDYKNSEKAKQYTHLLAVPGRHAQAREITQIQSLVKDIIKGVGDSILRDGDIVEGCQVVIDSKETTENDTLVVKKFARVTEGKVYLNGMVLPVKESEVDIVGVGDETIGFKLVETIITELDDPTLRDPAQGYPSTNRPGCNRIKSEVVIVSNDPTAATLVRLRDGSILVERYASTYSGIEQNLARRTYDESGSYIVNGLKVRAEKSSKNMEGYYDIVVEAGKAYILGHEIRIPAPRRIPNLRATDRGSDTNKIRIALINSEFTDTYNIGSPYVASIEEVKGPQSKTIEGYFESRKDVSDNHPVLPLGADEIVRIIEVRDSNNQVVSVDKYSSTPTPSSNYFYLEWLASETPSTASYQITYEYIGVINPSEYELVETHSLSSDQIKWNTPNSLLVSGTTKEFSVTYSYYKARNDIVYIDQYGEISIVNGTSNTAGYTDIPEVPINTLTLASIYNPPDSDPSVSTSNRVLVSNVGLTRFTMSDIQILLDRIRTLEYDQTVLSLNEEARNHEVPNKRGIFTDSLLDFSKIHYDYNERGIRYDATIDLNASICYLPLYTRTYDIFSSDIESIIDASKPNQANLYSRTATIKTSGDPVVVLSQDKATKAFPINPYTTFPELPEVSISPAVDSWIEDEIIEIPVSQNSSEIMSTSTRHVEINNTQGARRASTSNTNVVDTTIGTRVETSISESVVSEQSVTYIRSRVITVNGSKFPPIYLSPDYRIECYIDDVPVPLWGLDTPLEDMNSEDAPPIRVDDEGKFSAKFLIPEKTFPTGIREIEFRAENLVTTGDTNTELKKYGTSAIALYQASGVFRTIHKTVTTLTTVLLNRVTTVTTTNYIDPVGQTFVLDRMTIIKGVDLYFASKPSDGGAPVTCDIREVVNGNITSTIYGQKTLQASEVNPNSVDGSTPTRFNFDDPVLLEGGKEYAIVVRSISTEYTLWIAELGEIDKKSGESVLSNPYLVGLMMSSSNNSSWTSHQSADLKFQLLENTYEKKSEIYYKDLEDVEEFSRVYLLAESIIPNHTHVNWFYDIGEGYTAISPYSISTLRELKKKFSIKVELSRDENYPYLTPIIALDSIGAVLSSYDPNYDTDTGSSQGGYYVSNLITGLDDYNRVDIILDTINNDSIKVFISHEREEDLVEAELSEAIEMNYGWVESTYKATLPNTSKECRIFIKLLGNADPSAANHTTANTPAFRRLRAIMYEATSGE